LHLIGVAGGFGISFWITAVHSKIIQFISTFQFSNKYLGRTIQRMLTRQEFATVQSNLSTVYFSSSTVLAGLSLGTFLLRHPFHTWSRGATNLVCYNKKYLY
jgi:hypothetical protein